MGGYKTNSGENLRKEWKIPANQVRYHKDGTWFEPLQYFPGALADPDGYVLFETKQEYESSTFLAIGIKVNVTRGIKAIPTYIRVE